jgi:hypothetical protein
MLLHLLPRQSEPGACMRDPACERIALGHSFGTDRVQIVPSRLGVTS